MFSKVHTDSGKLPHSVRVIPYHRDRLCAECTAGTCFSPSLLGRCHGHRGQSVRAAIWVPAAQTRAQCSETHQQSCPVPVREHDGPQRGIIYTPQRQRPRYSLQAVHSHRALAPCDVHDCTFPITGILSFVSCKSGLISATAQRYTTPQLVLVYVTAHACFTPLAVQRHPVPASHSTHNH